jgi:hypothetical protein
MPRALIALAAATTAGTAATLGLAAAADAWTRDGAIILIALAAVFVAQPIPHLLRRRRQHANPNQTHLRTLPPIHPTGTLPPL